MNIPTPDVGIAGLITALVALIRPIVPEKASPYIPLIVVGIGAGIGASTPAGWLVGAISGLAAAGVYKAGADIAKKASGN